MSSGPFADSGRFSTADLTGSLDFRPRASRLLARFLIGVHALAALAVLLWVPGRGMVAALLGLVALSFIRNYRRHVLHRGKYAPRRVICQADGRWLLQDHRGKMQEARLLPSSYLHPRLVILNFALQQRPRRRNLVLCPDSLDAQTLRQLRARLRLAAQGQPDAGYGRA
ncbi:MAG TPA: protein YgfX [Nevskiales bacterium]|nr:protein YgfX [Nevskiales bacterium]